MKLKFEQENSWPHITTSPMSSLGTYTCDMCRKTYTKGWADEEAEQEALEIHGVSQARIRLNMAIVCDPCFNTLKCHFRPAKKPLKIS